MLLCKRIAAYFTAGLGNDSALCRALTVAVSIPFKSIKSLRATAIYGVAAIAGAIGVFHLPSCHHLIASSFVTSQKYIKGRSTMGAIAARILFCLVTHPVKWPSICSIVIQTNANDSSLQSESAKM